MANDMKFFPTLEDCGLARDFLEQGSAASRLAPLLDRPEVVERIMQDDVPIPMPKNRIQYFKENHLDYWLSGYNDMEMLQSFVPEPPDGPILDFGGSTGRVIRHWIGRHADDLYLCDMQGPFMRWAQAYLWPHVKPHQNSAHPVLPFPDNSFGMIYALSVFTHIDDHELGWLCELRRVLKPGGKLLVTVHNERTWEVVPDLQFRLGQEVLPNSPGYNEFRENHDGAPDHAVFVYKDRLTNVFCSNAYINKYWGEYFHIDRIVDEAHNYQAMVVMQPK